MTDEHDGYTSEQGYYVPPRHKPKDDAGYFAVLCEATFQAGFSWEVVRNKWPNFIKAFDGFDIDKVARYGPDDVDRLLADKGIVRNARKIEAAIANALTMKRLIAEHGSFYKYLRTLDGLPYPKRRKALESQFKWLGKTGVFVWLYQVAEEVPDWENR